MSGVAKKIKKTFKKVWKSLKKVVTVVAIAAAVYFTAGLALSAFPATASFAASMPGFAGGGFMGLGIGSGATAGTGIFTKVAAKFGLAAIGKGGGLVGGALASGTSTAALANAGISAAQLGAGAASAANSGLISGAAASASQAVAPAAVASASGAPLAATKAGVEAGVALSTGSAVGPAASAGMALSDKLLLASTGLKAVSGLLAPSPREIADAQKRWSGAFYGDEGGGAAAPPPPPLIPLPSTAAAKVKPPSGAKRTVPSDTSAARNALISPSYRYGQTGSGKPASVVDAEFGVQESAA
jgi:hypothetical protein